MRRALLITALTLAAGCASLPGDPTLALGGAEVASRTEANGDVVSEYRIAGQVRVVKIEPRTGPTYYLVDDNADGVLDRRQGRGPISPVQYRLFSW